MFRIPAGRSRCAVSWLPGLTLPSGGLDDDTLFSADNAKDRDNCGNGSGDTVTADAYDTIVHCETIHLTP